MKQLLKNCAIIQLSQLLISSPLLCGSAGELLMHENEISGIIVDAAFKVHTTLGPGLLESVYEIVLAYELEKRGLNVVVQQAIPVIYEEVKLELGFRADIIVNNKFVIEVKSVEVIAPVHPIQLRTYLRLLDLKLGLFINFNVPLIKDGIQRVVNNL
jgi:GxxExxY protein